MDEYTDIPAYTDLGGMVLAYQIYYSPENNTRYPTKVRKHKCNKKWLVTIIALMLLIIAVQKNQKFRKLLLPMDESETNAWLTSLMTDVQAEGNVKDALTAFCQDVIENAT